MHALGDLAKVLIHAVGQRYVDASVPASLPTNG